jgi:hypothetical protein
MESSVSVPTHPIGIPTYNNQHDLTYNRYRPVSVHDASLPKPSSFVVRGIVTRYSRLTRAPVCLYLDLSFFPVLQLEDKAYIRFVINRLRGH